ncbi:Uncharacterised protein [Arachnia propionica]|nr:Uncharacterised protein [Arachnia propionica]
MFGLPLRRPGSVVVSMKSGLEGRNNPIWATDSHISSFRVSMKSGLEGRNNWADEDKFILELLSQ